LIYLYVKHNLMNKLKKIIHQAILEVLNEDDPNAIKGTINISDQDPDEQEKVQQAQTSNQSYSVYETLDEMARIATLVKAGKEDILKANQEKYDGTWVGDLIDAVVAKPEGISQQDLVIAAGKKRQQDINPYIRKFIQDGSFTLGELTTPKQVKPESTGILGRPQSEEGAKKVAAYKLMQKIKDNPSYEPSEDEIKVIGKDKVEEIIALMVSGGIKRGRKVGPSLKQTETPLKEMARTATTYKIGDLKKLDGFDPKLRDSKWVKGIIDYLEEKGTASTIEIAREKFQRPQQAINQLILALGRAGILIPSEGNEKLYAKKQNTYYNEEIPDEYKDDDDDDDDEEIFSAEDYFIGNKFSNRKHKEVEPDEDIADPKIPDLPKDGVKHKPKISDTDYADLMKYLDYNERIKKINGNLNKSSRSIKGSDLGKTDNSNEYNRLITLRSEYEQKLDDLKQNSPYIKAKLDKEKSKSQMVAETLRMQKLANIVNG
jgi:hypothetical protein